VYGNTAYHVIEQLKITAREIPSPWHPYVGVCWRLSVRCELALRGGFPSIFSEATLAAFEPKDYF